jgi:hypothetical protein
MAASFTATRVSIATVLVLVSAIYEAVRNRVIGSCNASWPVRTIAFLTNLFHHVLSVYTWFGGFLFGMPVLHLVLICTIFALWYIFGSDCILHVWYQSLCGYKSTAFFDAFDLLTWGNGRLAKNWAAYVVIGFDILMIALTTCAETR